MADELIEYLRNLGRGSGPATEETLQRLIAVISDGQTGLAGELDKSAKAAKENTKQTQQNTQSNKRLKGSVEELESAYDDAVASLKQGASDIAGSFSAAGKGIFDFANSADQGGASLIRSLGNTAGGLTEGLNKMTGGIAGGLLKGLGTFATVFTGVTATVYGAGEQVFDTFQSLNRTGVTFGGSMSALAQASVNAGATLEVFSNAVSKNAPGLTRFAGSATAGAQALSGISGAIRNTELEQSLARMGIAVKDQPEFIGEFLSTMSRSQITLRSFGGDFGRVAATAVKYRKDLALLSELTGESAEQQKAANEQLKSDAQFQAIIAGMGPEQVASIEAVMSSMSQMEREMFKQQMAFGGLRGETAKAGALFPGLSGNIQDLAASARMGRTDLAEQFALGAESRKAQMQQSLAANQSALAMGALPDAVAEASLVARQRIQGDADAAIAQANKLSSAQDRLTEAYIDQSQSFMNMRNALSGALVELMGSDGFFASMKTLKGVVDGISESIPVITENAVTALDNPEIVAGAAAAAGAASSVIAKKAATDIVGNVKDKISKFGPRVTTPTSNQGTPGGGPASPPDQRKPDQREPDKPDKSKFGPRLPKGLKVPGTLGALIGAYELGSIVLDDSLTKEEKIEQGAGAAGGIGGAAAGALAGAALGSAVPIIGTTIGGLIGGTLGYFGGDFLGDMLGKNITEFMRGSEPEQTGQPISPETLTQPESSTEFKPQGRAVTDKTRQKPTVPTPDETGKSTNQLLEELISAVSATSRNQVAVLEKIQRGVT